MILLHLARLGLLVAYGQEQPPQPPPDPCQGRISVLYEKGRLTARLDRCPLGRVLEEISNRTKVALIPADPVTGDLTSAAVRDVPLEDGLRQLFAGYDLFFFYGAAREVPSALRTVWIYPPNSASSLRPVPPELWASAKDLEVMLSAPDPESRERAYTALMTRPDQRSRDLVIHAILGLTERDDQLRQRLLSSANANGFKVPPDLLAQLARADNSAELRWMALDALSTSALAKTTAQAALADPDESVREKAKQILEQLESTERPR